MKKPFIYLLTAGLVFSMIADTNTMYAESTGSSKATVTFTTPKDAVIPVDPRDPSEYYPGIDLELGEEENYGLDGNVTGDQGLLSLDYISNLNFEGGVTTEENILLNATTLLPSVQVTDRRNTGAGWNLTANAGNFSLRDDDDNKNTLVGYEMSFTGGSAKSADEELLAPKTPDFVLSSEGGAVTVASAAGKADEKVTSAQGIYTWAIGWLEEGPEAEVNSNITLDVPQYEASEGMHEVTIDWTLTSGPATNHDELDVN